MGRHPRAVAPATEIFSPVTPARCHALDMSSASLLAPLRSRGRCRYCTLCSAGCGRTKGTPSNRKRHSDEPRLDGCIRYRQQAGRAETDRCDRSQPAFFSAEADNVHRIRPSTHLTDSSCTVVRRAVWRRPPNYSAAYSTAARLGRAWLSRSVFHGPDQPGSSIRQRPTHRRAGHPNRSGCLPSTTCSSPACPAALRRSTCADAGPSSCLSSTRTCRCG